MFSFLEELCAVVTEGAPNDRGRQYTRRKKLLQLPQIYPGKVPSHEATDVGLTVLKTDFQNLAPVLRPGPI